MAKILMSIQPKSISFGTTFSIFTVSSIKMPLTTQEFNIKYNHLFPMKILVGSHSMVKRMKNKDQEYRPL